MKTVLSFDEIEYFTSYEALMFLDLAKDPSLSGGLPNFFHVILGDIEKPVKSNLLDPIFHLRQGNGLIKRIQSSPFSEEEIINNIRKHLRNQASCDYLFEEMSGVIARGCMSKKDTEDFQEDSLNQIDDFATLLYKALIFSLEKQASDHKALKHLYDVRFESNSNKAKPNYSYDIFFKKLNEMDGLDGLKRQEIEPIMKVLKKVSQKIANDVFSQKERYCVDKINERLLTKGIEFTTFAESDNGTHPMSEFFQSEDNLLIIGDGGIGKTCFLVNELQKTTKDQNLIPIFVTLSNLKYNSMQRANHFIRSFILNAIKDEVPASFLGSESADYYLAKALDASHDNRKIILFLDGLNEISNIAGSALKTEIQKEISELASFRNVRIVLTSRAFDNSNTLFQSFRHIHATGIDDNTLHNFLLTEVGYIPTNKKLMQILHIPLFLLMYVSSEVKADTRGGILFEYCNGIKSSYNEIRLMRDPIFVKEELPTYMPLLLGFILPAVAAHMEKQDVRCITKNDLDDIIANAASLTMPFKNSNDSYFNRYSVDSALSALTRDLISAGSIVQKIILDRLTFLQKDVDGNFSFSHQFYQDYFACLFRIYTYSQDLNTESPYREYACALMNTDTLSLTKEIADQSNLLSLSSLTDVLQHVKINEGFFSRNLLTMLSLFNHNSLAGLTFENFDFSNVAMSSFQFSNDESVSKFVNCIFSEVSFLSYDESTKFIHKITTYHNRPALCEIIINGDKPYLRYIDLKTENELHAKSWNMYYVQSYDDFDKMNDVILSDDKKYAILYDNTFRSDFFFVLSEEKENITKQDFAYPQTETLFSFFKEDKLIVIYRDFFFGHVHNLLFEEPTLDYFEIDTPSGTQTILYEDEAIIDTFVIPASVLPIYKKINIFGNLTMSHFYSYHKYMIAIFNTPYIEDAILIFDTETEPCSIYPVSSIEKPLFSNTRTPFTYMCKDHIYISFANFVYDLDIMHMMLIKLFELPSDEFVTCMKKTNHILSVSTNYSFFDFDLYEKNITEKCNYIAPHMHYSHAYCDNYMVVGSTEKSLCASTIYRLDDHEISRHIYARRVTILHVEYLSNNRIVIVYSSGYVALVDGISFKLINTFTIPKGYSFYHLAYNQEKEHLAIAIYEKQIQTQKPTILFILEVSDYDYFEVIHVFEKQYYECKVCYSLDGNYLFEDNMGTLLIYETESYNLIHVLEVGYEFLFMKAYRHYMCAIVKSDEAELLSVNIEKLNRGELSYYYSDIRDIELEELKESLYMHEVCPNYYEVVYESKLNDDFEVTPWLRFFYDTSGDAPSDYYQDGILVRCKDEYATSADIPTYKLSYMTPTFGHIDKASHTYFGMTIDHRFAKINLSTRDVEAIDIVPNLYIKDCHFYFDKRPVELICGIIKDNLGIIE